ncbi:class F sortase [Herbiconiux sp. L3-i23]|uniref:class F sortase n=1 Tax=Herbiconiux sp. L3-i23 TaxID=2905871 RepID=UPI00205EF13D|nr:class F sortase [Herbiconiux sp. L3-i23]BDI23188.1 hypothetical protein L3i23_19640 [Herbiconiux sp. L3-i23]
MSPAGGPSQQESQIRRAAVDPEVRSAALPPVAPEPAPPARVALPSVGVDVPIVPTGVRADGGMEIPDDPSVAGWYRWSAAPGGPAGNTVVAAHVDSLRFGLGPFVALRDVAVGATVTVTTADGAAHDYLVESVTHVPKADLASLDVFDRTGPPTLALITCGGGFDEVTRTYSDNVVVLATEAT